jgi:hypothetical protein
MFEMSNRKGRLWQGLREPAGGQRAAIREHKLSRGRGWPNLRNDRTLEQIQRDGLIALRERLGVEGMVRFLQQFASGSGDYATERRKWVKKNSL